MAGGLPPGFVLDPPQAGAAPAAPPPGFVLDPPVDLRRPAVVDDETWFRQTYGRNPVSADEAGTNDPASFRARYGFDPVAPPGQEGRALGDDPYGIRAVVDPEGHAAYQAQLQQGMPDYGGTNQWDESQLIPISGPGQFLRRAVNSATLGWSDEIAGLLGGNTDVERQLLQGYEVANPMAARAADLVGGAVTAAIPGGAITRGATTASRVARGAAAGAAVGAASGAGHTDADWSQQGWSDRAQGALAAAIPTSVIGGAIPVVAPYIARNLRGIIPERAGAVADELPTTADMRTASQAAYQRADDAGLVVGQGNYQDFALNAYQRMLDEGLPARPEIARALVPRAAALTDLVLLEAGRVAHSLTDLEQLRRIISNAASATDPTEQRLALVLRDQVDDWLDSLTPGQVIAGNPQEAAAALREARGLWSRMRKTELIEGIENRAQISVGQSVNAAGVEQALRREFGNLAKNTRAMSRFTPEERDAIMAVVNGGALDGLLRRLATFAPRGFFSTALGVMGASTVNPAMLGLSVAGEGALRFRNARTLRRVGELNSVVRRGPEAAGGQPTGTNELIRLLTSANSSQTPEEARQRVPSLVQLLSGGQPLPVR